MHLVCFSSRDKMHPTLSYIYIKREELNRYTFTQTLTNYRKNTYMFVRSLVYNKYNSIITAIIHIIIVFRLLLILLDLKTQLPNLY